MIAAATDLDLVEARCRVSLDAFLDDLGFVLRRAPAPLPVDAKLDHVSGARLDRVVLAILETVLDASREILARDPSQLVPILCNELYWYDAPARADHGDTAVRPRERQLWRWMDHRAAFETRVGDRWLRSLRPPQLAHASLPRWRTPGKVRAVSADGTSALVRRDHLGLLDLRTGTVRHTFVGVTRAGFAPAGRRFVVCSNTAAAIWDADTLAPPIVLSTSHVRDAVWSHDGEVVFLDEVHQARAFRAADGTCLATRTFDVRGLRTCRGGVLLLDVRSWQHWDPVRDVVTAPRPCSYSDYLFVSPSGDLVVTYQDAKLEGVALPDATPVFQVESQASRLAFHPSGRSFVTSDGRTRDATTGEKIGSLPIRDTDLVSFDPAGRFLLAGYWNRVELLEVETATVVARVEASRPEVEWSRDGRVLAINDRDSALIADVASLGPPVRWRDDARRVRTEWTTRFSPSGATLVVDHDGGIAFWDTTRGVIRSFVAAEFQRAFSARGHRVFASQGDALVALWTEDGSEIWRATVPSVPEDRMDADVYAADEQGVVLHGHHKGKLVIALGMDDGCERYRLAGALALHDRDVFLIRDANHLTLRAIETGAAVATLPVLGGRLAVSPDRRWLAAYDYDVQIWDLTTSTLRHKLALQYSFNGFSFRADSATLQISSYQTQQSGNQDWNAEEVVDVFTGKKVDAKGWWDQDAEPSSPREITPGILREDGGLRVDGTLLPLPDQAVVCVAERGDVLVASTAHGRVELAILTPGRR